MNKNKVPVSEVLGRIWSALKYPLVATLFGLFAGAIVILISNENPIEIYAELFTKSFIKPYYLMQTLTRSTPIIIAAIATAAAWKAGYINIGVEGQMIVGSLSAVVVATMVDLPEPILLVVSILVGLIAGALYATVASILNIKYKASIVIVTLMMNYVAKYVTSYFVTYPLKDSASDKIAVQTAKISEGLRLMKLGDRTTFNIGIIIAILVVFWFIFLSEKTVFGYESKMTGFNPFFAKYGGVKEKNVMLKTMALSGAIAALGGILEIYGVKYRYIDGMFTSAGYAWTGLMSALISGLNPIGMLFSSIFLSGLQVGGQALQRSTSIPIQMSDVIQACITLFVSVKFTKDYVKTKKKSSKLENKKIGGEPNGC